MNPEKELQSIKNYIKSRVDSYSDKDPVYYIEAGFQFDQDGWLCIFFDTRKDAGPDGEWTVHIEGNSIDYNHWMSESEKYEYEEFGAIIGNLIKQSFFELKEEGVFNKLNKSEYCEFGIEEINGTYGWPNYEDRKKENLV